MRTAIEQADTKTRLEDLYLPYKKKRRTKGQIAIEAGFEPLTDVIMADFNVDPEVLAEQYLNNEFNIPDSKATLDGAKFILMERFTDHADLLARLRQIIADKGMLMSSVSKDKEETGEKFRDYFDYREPISKVPPHRALALFRGRKESILAKSLDAVVEDCVNAVGVEVNTASVALLNRVSGLSETQASNIVEWRNANGRIKTREQLKSIPRLGAKAFEQAAGFLQVQNGDVVLDASAVHPESYSLVAEMAKRHKCKVIELVGNKSILAEIQAKDFVSSEVGLPTVLDIIAELDKPGRDPRPEFKAVSFKEGIEKLSDLTPDMILEGCVTNVTNFGAFVDVGVHQDGLVHISALANTFVKDPREIVKTGDIVKVKVMEVDVKRKRIALSMRLDDSALKDESTPGSKHGAKSPRSDNPKPSRQSHQKKTPPKSETKPEGAFAAAFAAAKSRQ